MQANAGFQSVEEVSKWFTFYYLSPNPERFPEAIEYMSQNGMLDNKNAISPIFGFMSGVFGENAHHVENWVKRLSVLKEEHKIVVVLGIWYADIPQSKKLAYELLNKSQYLNEKLSYIRKGDPLPINKIPLEQGPWVLDALWGNFVATGKNTPVKRIMAALPWVDIKGDVNKLLVGGAARWSLTSNAVQHDRVFDFCKVEIDNQPKEIALKLREVLENAKVDKEKRHNKALKSGTPKSSAP